MSTFRAVQHYGRVLLLIDGRLVADIPHQSAIDVSNAIRSVAKQAEEWDQAERIAMDQAILTRCGAPFGLTNNPKIMGEAIKEALHNRDLRRYIPPARALGIQTREMFGTPTLIQTPPRRTAQ